jgi:hypothetical protein
MSSFDLCEYFVKEKLCFSFGESEKFFKKSGDRASGYDLGVYKYF